MNATRLPNGAGAMTGSPRLRGVTLPELMLVISIVAILLGLGVPSFSVFIAEQRVRAMATELQSALWRTRSEAIKFNRDVTLSPPPDAEHGWESGWVALHPIELGQVLLQADALPDVRVNSAPASVTYRPSGRVRGMTAPDFDLASETVGDARRRCLRVDLMGLPKIHKGGCTP
jgi:type IV fimbrial biogenesis protein FimT